MTADDQFFGLLGDLAHHGRMARPRDQETRELLGWTTRVDMARPIVTCAGRGLDYQFMVAEAAWILSGDRRLNHPVLVKNLSKYSDNGATMRGAYGPPFIQQVEYVVDAFATDYSTRQAVVTLWERSPRLSRDIPCTVALQWLIRDETIHCNVFMRSSDAWLGWPYDVFTFTMMTLHVMLSLGRKLFLGELTIFAGSQHIYERHFDRMKSLLGNLNFTGENLAIDRSRLNNPDDLMNVLIATRDAPDDHFNQLKRNLCH